MIDMTTGRVAYAVVAFGGTLGLTDKWIAMPFDALCWAPDRRKFIIDLKREVLINAPGIDKNKWPDHYMESDTGWMNDLYQHYNCKPYWGNDTMSMATSGEGSTDKNNNIDWMEEYLKQLRLEEQGVMEKIASMKSM